MGVAFSKSSLNIWKFSVHILLKPHLKNFEHYFASMWDECNCSVVWTFFETGMKTDLFQSCGHCWVFQICWRLECSTFTASSSRIWKSSTGIPLPTVALFVVMKCLIIEDKTLTKIKRQTESLCVDPDESLPGAGWWENAVISSDPPLSPLYKWGNTLREAYDWWRCWSWKHWLWVRHMISFFAEPPSTLQTKQTGVQRPY